VGSYAVYRSANADHVRQGGEFTSLASNETEKNRSILAVTQAEEHSGIRELLAFNHLTDQWNVTEEELRHISTVSFSDREGKFHFLHVAHIVRLDAGKDAASDGDKLEVLTTGGHRIRYWESIGELEVKWYDHTTSLQSREWETLSLGRRLADEPFSELDLPPDVEVPDLVFEDEADELVWDVKLNRWVKFEFLPPIGRRTKGRTVVIGAAGFHGGHRSNSHQRCEDLGNGEHMCFDAGRSCTAPGWFAMASVFVLRALLTDCRCRDDEL